MKRYLNKALIYKDFKSVWWIIILLSIFNSKFVGMNNATRIVSKHRLGNYFGFRIFFNYGTEIYLVMLIIAMMSYIIIRSDRKNTARNLMNYMPFNKGQRVISKVLVGVFIIFVASFIGFLINSIMFINNYIYLKSVIRFKYIIGFFIVSFFVYSSIYILYICVQCVCKNSVFGTVLGIAVIYFPYAVETNLVFLLDKFNIDEVMVIKIIDSLCIPQYLRVNAVVNGGYIVSDKIMKSMGNLIVVIFILSVSLIFIVNKVNLNEDAMVKISKKKEIIFKIFSALALSFLVSDGISKTMRVQNSSRIYIVIIDIVLFIICYFVYERIDKIIKLSRYGWSE
ncbi:hypothetical protein [Clostridium felsineum]|uniref:Uncharacterized protein n=1 Tax=Clostridium felsineum TaxID=36839 RepID=A0A1S8MBH9_9CLOT|nr:hypothetical protein [Clostridium felsineum]URZ02655.1 hypothetical protein CLAUR_026770 [Clostridium felsineum]URZ09022.1 hypothetical protein CLROS_044280 [Clostridium felsineum]URZ09650.1 hypothetical protein CROST_003330 [Clostridium felsineum]